MLFLQRADAVNREPELQAFWEKERIYERLLEENAGEKYVLHDGPPYANGDLHMGHALNKVRTCHANLTIIPQYNLTCSVKGFRILILLFNMFCQGFFRFSR